MKIAFISDIHGNASALAAVLHDTRSKSVDQICVLGDLCYRGPAPKRSLHLIRALQSRVIKGNADEWVVRGVRRGEVREDAIEMMNVERDWTVSQLDQEEIDYLHNLPTELHLNVEGVSISAFHATPGSLFETVPPDADDAAMRQKLMSAADTDVYVYGHIHKPFVRYMHGKIIVNTGSVGLPFDGMTKASYAIVQVEQGRVGTSIERVPFAAEDVIREYEEVRYPNAQTMARIIRNGRVM
ncbi:metallophosphoesterase family protein [Paenibacillus xerothermodurans]|uniref:Phosphoesterase n=1 Tax=Paenibacillus xerothermodurans TaxID=1977292 RepID=A0A2W1P3A2_PAEXE|nr:metallophosphoesterase family protein [Paenibacillus xerothermodurans]PZE21648.1 metallophosphoesterase [Paenibacillus xerothermodurans]